MTRRGKDGGGATEAARNRGKSPSKPPAQVYVCSFYPRTPPLGARRAKEQKQSPGTHGNAAEPDPDEVDFKDGSMCEDDFKRYCGTHLSAEPPEILLPTEPEPETTILPVIPIDLDGFEVGSQSPMPLRGTWHAIHALQSNPVHGFVLSISSFE